jgi:hypothetical protein
MRYMMLIYSHEDDAATQDDRRTVSAGHTALMEDARTSGVFRGADPLEASVTATTIRIQNGKTVVTDGPYAETKEQLAGYYILECQDLDEALAWAAKIPTACQGAPGCVEVRPIREYPQGVPVNG